MTDRYTVDDAEEIIAASGPWCHKIFGELYIHLNHAIWLMNYAYEEGKEDNKDIGIAEERLKNPTTITNLKDM